MPPIFPSEGKSTQTMQITSRQINWTKTPHMIEENLMWGSEIRSYFLIFPSTM